MASRRPISDLSTSDPDERVNAGASAPRRVLILSADVGEGHAAAARALREQLERSGEAVEVTLIDGLAAMGSLLRSVVEDGYRTQLRVAPHSYSLYYWLLKHAPPVRGLTKLLLTRLGARPLAREIERHAPDVVVSTYPAITVVLGYMRRRRMLQVPAIATITDMTGLFFWAQRGIDTHLVMYEASVREIERIAGRGSAQLVRPLIAAEFLEPREPAAARAALGLPRHGHVVVVSGGGWGVGDLAGAVAELERIPDTTVVCVAGRNELVQGQLIERFGASENVRVLGFTDQMAELLAAADVLVHSTGGVTCLEAMARGCPVVSYGLPVGHAKLNTRRMAEHELLALASSPAELVEHVERTRDAAPRPAAAIAADGLAAADVVLRPPTRVRPIARWRLASLRVATSMVMAIGMGVWVMSTDELDALANVLSHPVKTVPAQGQAAVRVIVDVPAADVVPAARRLRREGIRASFAVTTAPSPRTLRVLHRLGDDVIPAISGGGGLHWIQTATEVRREARIFHLRRGFYYLEPPDPSFGELILGSVAGAKGVAGSVQLGARVPELRPRLRPGDVVVLRLAGPAATSLRALRWLGELARDSGLAGLPLPPHVV
jgi:processive 1,2-diacylglycerol beta-glucosyltransferase